MEKSTDPPASLSIVVPCYNEKSTIRHVIETVLAADSLGLKKEVVIVDDASQDGTRDLLHELEQDYRTDQRGSVKVFYHEQNQGKGAAVRTGFSRLTGDLVLVQDADLEYDPADYPVLLRPILTGHADAVFGNRFHGAGAHRVMYFWHYQANRMLTLICNMFTDLNLGDMEVGYKLFRREVLEQMNLKSNRFGFEPEVTIKTAKLGCRLYEVPISYYGRTYAEGKKIGWRDGVAALWHMIKYRFLE
jgi:glycosyltransferase involved in cell wall biosynthesis